MNPYYCSRSMVTPLLRWKAAVTSASASARGSIGGGGGGGGIRNIAILPSSQQLPQQQQQQQQQLYGKSTTTATSTATTTLTTIRSKHSSTQIKRLFKKNPAKRRVALKKNMGNGTTSGGGSTVEVDGNRSSSAGGGGGGGGGVIPEPKFAPVIESPKFLPNGWCPLPTDAASAGGSLTSKYPFRVSRTGNKPQNSVGFLPVYSEYRCGFFIGEKMYMKCWKRDEGGLVLFCFCLVFFCSFSFSSQVCFVSLISYISKHSTDLSICIAGSPAYDFHF